MWRLRRHITPPPPEEENKLFGFLILKTGDWWRGWHMSGRPMGRLAGRRPDWASPLLSRMSCCWVATWTTCPDVRGQHKDLRRAAVTGGRCAPIRRNTWLTVSSCVGMKMRLVESLLVPATGRSWAIELRSAVTRSCGVDSDAVAWNNSPGRRSVVP